MTKVDLPPTDINKAKELVTELEAKIAARQEQAIKNKVIDKEEDIALLQTYISSGAPKDKVEILRKSMNIDESEINMPEVKAEPKLDTEKSLKEQKKKELEEKDKEINDKILEVINQAKVIGIPKEDLISQGIPAEKVAQIYDGVEPPKEEPKVNESKPDQVKSLEKAELEVEKARAVYTKEYLKCKKEMKKQLLIEKTRTTTFNILAKANNAIWGEKNKKQTFKEEDYFTKEFKDAKKKYNEARNELGHEMWNKKKAELEAQGLAGEALETALIQYRATEIKDRVFLDEHDKLNEAKAEGAPIKKALWKRVVQGYMNLKPWQKRALSVGLFTAAAGTGIVGMGAYAGYSLGSMALIKLGSSMAIGRVTSYLVKGIDRLSYFKNKDAKFNEKQEGNREELAQRFALGEITIEEYDKESALIHDAERKHTRDRMLLKAGTGIAVAGLLGGATSYGMGHIGTHHLAGAASVHEVPNNPVTEQQQVVAPVEATQPQAIEQPTHTIHQGIHKHVEQVKVEAKEIPTGPETPGDSGIKIISPTKGIDPEGTTYISPTGNADVPGGIEAHDIPTETQTDINHSALEEQNGIKIDVDHPKEIPTGSSLNEIPDNQSGLNNTGIDIKNAQEIPTRSSIENTTGGVNTTEITGAPTGSTITEQPNIKVIPAGSISPIGERNFNALQREDANIVGDNGFTREVPMTNTEQAEYLEKINTSNSSFENINRTSVYEVGDHQGAANVQSDFRHVETVKDLRKEIGRYDFKHNTITEKPLDINGKTLKFNNMNYVDVNKAIDYNFESNNLKFSSYENYEKERELQALFGNNNFNESTRSIDVDYFRAMPEWKVVNKIPAKYFFDFEDVKEISGDKLINIPEADIKKLLDAKLITVQYIYINGTQVPTYTFSHQNELFRISDTYGKINPGLARPINNETIEQYVGRMTKTVHQTGDGTYFVVSKEVELENTDGSVVQSERVQVRNLQRSNPVTQTNTINPRGYGNRINFARRVSRVFANQMSTPVEISDRVPMFRQ